jgi:hypothetical protein
MGDPACYRDSCPACEMEVLITDEYCRTCGERLPDPETE